MEPTFNLIILFEEKSKLVLKISDIEVSIDFVTQKEIEEILNNFK